MTFSLDLRHTGIAICVRSVRSRASAMYSCFNSSPTKRRPCLTVTLPTVPVPQKGSSTMPRPAPVLRSGGQAQVERQPAEDGNHVGDVDFWRRLKAELAGHAVVPQAPVNKAGLE